MVVTVAMGEIVPRFEMESLGNRLAGVASLFLVKTVEATRAMTDLPREREKFFAGAAKVYPAGHTPENSLKPTPPRLVHPLQSPAVATQRLISDALGLAQDAGVFEKDRSRQRSAVALVKAFIGDDRAFVEVEGGEDLATLAVRHRSTLNGGHDASSKRFMVEEEMLDADAFLDGFPIGGVTCCLLKARYSPSGCIGINKVCSASGWTTSMKTKTSSRPQISAEARG